MRLPYRRALDATLYGTDLPYGYTLVIWGSGAALIELRGKPTIWLILTFVFSGAAAYGLLRVFTQGAAEQREKTLSDTPNVLLTGALHLAAIGAAVGTATLVGLLDTWGAWPLAGFGATLAYLCTSALDLALIMRRSD